VDESVEAPGLDRLRGTASPKRHTARTISALAANPGCTRRALMDASGADKEKIAARTGYPGPFGQSEFAIARGNAFEARIKDGGGAQALALLRAHLGLSVTEAGYTDLNDEGAGDSNERRYLRTKRLLASAGPEDVALFDHPLLRLDVGGRHAYLEPDLVAFQVNGQYHVVEIKSFSVIDGQAEAEKVAAAAIQSAVYVLALRDMLDDDERVHHETVLICPENFSNQPVAVSLDVRRQLTILKRQLSRLSRIDELLELYAGDLTFDLDPDPATGLDRRPEEDLRKAVLTVDANYAPECLSSCDLCYLCRDEAHGTTGALGKQVREDVGGVEDVASVLRLARGAEPPPGGEEAASQLRKAARLRAAITGEGITGEGITEEPA
jgi:hypothetical protein